MSNQFPEPQGDTVPTFLPILDDPLPADEAFRRWEESLDLRPEADALVVTHEPSPPVGRDWAFDFFAHRSVSSASGHGPVSTHGIATLRTWIEKALRVARGAHVIYSNSFGVDLPGDLFGGSVERFPSDEHEQQVRRALTVRKEILDIENYRAVFDPDEEIILVDFDVVLAGQEVLLFRGVRLGS